LHVAAGNGREPAALRISVAIITWNRPEFLRATLTYLAALDEPVHQVVVMDASAERREDVFDALPSATRFACLEGAGNMTRARNAALLRVTGDIVAFLDDDAYPRPAWSRNLASVFADPTVAAVAGRTCNGAPGEEGAGVEEVGRLLEDGRLTANFAADTRAVRDVDHGIGANMAFRASVLAELGGFRDGFRGASLCEETDLFLRVRALERRIVFAPNVVVDHVGAPYVTGRRFDWRYMFWSRHNHVLLLARNYGLASPLLARWLAFTLTDVLRQKGPGGRGRRLVRSALGLVAVLAGLARSVRSASLRPRDPRRRDRTGEIITAALWAAAEQPWSAA
jgi:GT2 family glycosyltransferase